MQLFLQKILLFLIIISIPCVFIEIKTDYNYGLSPYETILLYNINKIKTKKNITLGFFGDSSCGNAINAEKIHPNVANLSLVKNYNISASLEMIKQTKSIHKDLDTAIIMHSFDTFSIDSNWTHYIKNVDDLENRSYVENLFKKLRIFRPKLEYALMNFDFSNLFKISTPIVNDFLRQGKKNNNIQLSRVDTISNVNKKSIIDIINYCENQKIEYLFLFGPSTKINPDYDKLNELINFFDQNTKNYNSNNYTIRINNIGDSPYHANPLFKKESTTFYKNILMSHFNL